MRICRICSWITLVFIGVINLSPIEIQAQERIEIFSVSTQLSPRNEILGADRSADIFHGIANLKLPIKFSDRTICFNEFTYLHSQLYSSNEAELDQGNALQMQGMLFKSGVIQSLGNQQKLILLFTPRLMRASIRRSLDFQLGFTALYEKKFSEDLTMRYGGLYNEDLFGPMVIPLVYLDYQKSGSPWSFRGLLPIHTRINYQINKDWNAGFKHLGLITSYPAFLNRRDRYLERSTIDFSLYLERQLLGNLFLELRAGYTMARTFALYAEEDQLNLRIAPIKLGPEREQLNLEISDGAFIGAKVSYQLKVE